MHEISGSVIREDAVSKSKRERRYQQLKKSTGRVVGLLQKPQFSPHASAYRVARSLKELAGLENADLASVDIARMNLLCAEKLPGSESLNIEEILKTLDQWAKIVQFDTDRHLYKLQQKPGEYENSEAYFRMAMLITVLQCDLGVRYNLDRMRQIDFRNSKDLFIHGLVKSNNGGTCVSMPALYVAVGRRLGYPLKLVTTREHVFCRWEGQNHPNRAWRERRNIEGASQGMHSYSDEHYQHWPNEISQKEIDACGHLRSLTPPEELALFMCTRGHCSEDNGWLHDAFHSYKHANFRHPENVMYMGFGQQVHQKMMARARQRIVIPRPSMHSDPRWMLQNEPELRSDL
jgi:hypothetical protein